MSWRPLSKRGSAAAAQEYDALHEGIPDWLKPSIGQWIHSVFLTLCETTTSHQAEFVTALQGYDPNDGNFGALLQLIQRKLRMPLNWSTARTALESLIQYALRNPETGLDVIDMLLLVIPAYPHAEHVRGQLVEELSSILDQGNSKWCVSATHDSLEERVAPEVAGRAAALMTTGTRVAGHLRQAWHSVYGRNPNSSHAYREAVRAVEVAATSVVSPKNNRATLGTVIRDMKAAPSKRTVAFEPLVGDPVQHVIATLELLWTGEFDRHGTADESIPLNVSRQQAESAVHLALTLTHWFQTGAVR